MQAGMQAGWLSDWVGAEHLREYEVRFLAPVFPGDVLRLAGRSSRSARRTGSPSRTSACRCPRADEPVVRARARAVVQAYS
jgi:acyl dehydratase